MNARLSDIMKLSEYCFKQQKYIEPASMEQYVNDRLMDVMKTYAPEVTVKAGIGRGELLRNMARSTEGIIVVTEPSMSVISGFTAVTDPDLMKRIRIIQGDMQNLPVDYYRADLLVSVDSLNFMESGPVTDEFRRIMKFDGIFFISGIALHEKDEEGIFDDWMRTVFPLHNEYYMPEELRTVLELNEFSFVKGSTDTCPLDLRETCDFFAGLYDDRSQESAEIVKEAEDLFSSCYGLSDGKCSVPYYSGVFRRIKPDYVYEKK